MQLSNASGSLHGRIHGGRNLNQYRSRLEGKLCLPCGAYKDLGADNQHAIMAAIGIFTDRFRIFAS